MNPIAMRALEQALTRAAAPIQKPAPTAKLLPPILANEPLPELVITGPINRVMELEGKRYALEFVRALGSSVRREPTRTKAIVDLTRYAVAQPSSVASGIKLVINVLKEA